MEDTRTSNPGVRSVNPAAVASAPTAPPALQSRRAAGTFSLIELVERAQPKVRIWHGGRLVGQVDVRYPEVAE